MRILKKENAITLLLIVAFYLCATISANSQNFNSEVVAGIKTNDSKNDILDIIGTAKNITETSFSLRYELSVITNNGENNNSSKNSQSGRFTLEPFETKNLSQTSVLIDPDNRTVILLVIFDLDDQVMGTDRLVYDGKQMEQAEENISYQKPNEGIVLTGMVTDRSKTKPGRDFYDFFFQKYSLSPNQGNKIIEIDEMISFGRTTRVMVKIDNQIIYQFFARPKLDFLKEQADIALKQVNRYFEYLKNRNELPKY
ncbi:curli assembly protein CsgE [Gillisia limnaea]|uniref:Curli production assembly/transport component CsgE n=1 Tax=Gillisia limnaea (strain DSM 15749 / LMG 21470 / R-8282) TaxID=865937 RepID=H2BS47_GILLR|nr:curli assembly protein CsgE [Gillisia limnaea]EHQ03573.1 Curli assembly protein CsgE [Gillisia limnaea DSM 15749]